MRPKKVSKALKRHHQTFYLARRDPERWERERNITLSESLNETQEKVGIAKRETDKDERLLEHIQQQVSPVVVRDDGLTKPKG